MWKIKILLIKLHEEGVKHLTRTPSRGSLLRASSGAVPSNNPALLPSSPTRALTPTSKKAWGAVETGCVPPMTRRRLAKPPTYLHSVEVSKKVANCPGTLFPIVLGLLPASVVLPIQRLREGSRPKPPVTLLGRHEFCSDMM